jgi:hypothetical protein
MARSLRLPELLLDAVELVLKALQQAVGLGELGLRRTELPKGGVRPGRLGRERGADLLEFVLRHPPEGLVRVGRSQLERSAGRHTSRRPGRARIIDQSGAETLAAMLAADPATEMLAPDLQVAPLTMGAASQDMP